MQREGHLTALAFLVEENTEVSKPKTYELLLVVPGFAAPRASATSTRRERTCCAWGMQGTHVSPQCTTKLHGVESPAYACAHAAMFVISCAHRLRHVQQTGLCPPSQLGKEHSTLLARHGNDPELPCPRHYSCPLSQPLPQPALPFQVASLSYSVWHQSCRCLGRTNSSRHADGKHGGPAAVQTAALMFTRENVVYVGCSLARTTMLQAFQGKSVGSAASDYACRCTYLHPVSEAPLQLR